MNQIKQHLQEQLDALLSNELHLEVEQDELAYNPRVESDNAGVICVKRSCRHLSNECEGFEFDNFTSLKGVMKWLRKEKGAIMILPIYAYDHSGVTINTTGFNSPYGNGWDTAMIGLYYTTADLMKKIWGEDISKSNMKEYLIDEIAILDKYVSGEIYAYKIKNTLGNVIDSCGGYYDQNQAYNDGTELMKDLQEVYNAQLVNLKGQMARIQELPYMPL